METQRGSSLREIPHEFLRAFHQPHNKESQQGLHPDEQAHQESPRRPMQKPPPENGKEIWFRLRNRQRDQPRQTQQLLTGSIQTRV